MSLDPALVEQLLAQLDPQSAAAVDQVLADQYPYGWIPNTGPQTTAYWSQAHRILYGGAAGGGKSELAIGWGLQRHRNVILFRQAYTDLDGPRGLAGRFKTVLGDIDGWRGDILAWAAKDGSGKSFEFSAIGRPNFEEGHQGRPTDGMLFDEAAQMSEARVRYALGWNRAADGYEGTCQAIFSSNPPQGSEGQWLLRWWQPWLDPSFAGEGGPAAHGEIRWCAWSPSDTLVWMPLDQADAPIVWTGPETYRMATPEEAADIDDPDVYRPLSHTFIPAALKDNPYLRGTGYLANLQAMPEPLRTQLMKGDFLAGREDSAFQVIPTAYVDAAIERGRTRNLNRLPMTALGVDVAQGGADKTALAPLYGSNSFGPITEVRGADTPDGPAVLQRIVGVRRGRAVVVIDCTGGHGGDAATQCTQQGLPTVRFVASQASGARTQPGQELGFLNQRSEMWWRFREAIMDPTEELALPDDPILKAELCSPEYLVKRGVIQIESKDELKKRLGRSTNRADAVLQAFLKRDHAGIGGPASWAAPQAPASPHDFHDIVNAPSRDPWANGASAQPWANTVGSHEESSPFDLL